MTQQASHGRVLAGRQRCRQRHDEIRQSSCPSRTRVRRGRGAEGRGLTFFLLSITVKISIYFATYEYFNCNAIRNCLNRSTRRRSCCRHCYFCYIGACSRSSVRRLVSAIPACLPARTIPVHRPATGLEPILEPNRQRALQSDRHSVQPDSPRYAAPSCGLLPSAGLLSKLSGPNSALPSAELLEPGDILPAVQSAIPANLLVPFISSVQYLQLGLSLGLVSTSQ